MAVSAFTERAADHNSHPRGGFPHQIVSPARTRPVTKISRLLSGRSWGCSGSFALLLLKSKSYKGHWEEPRPAPMGWDLSFNSPPPGVSVRSLLNKIQEAGTRTSNNNNILLFVPLLLLHGLRPYRGPLPHCILQRTRQAILVPLNCENKRLGDCSQPDKSNYTRTKNLGQAPWLPHFTT